MIIDPQSCGDKYVCNNTKRIWLVRKKYGTIVKDCVIPNDLSGICDEFRNVKKRTSIMIKIHKNEEIENGADTIRNNKNE